MANQETKKVTITSRDGKKVSGEITILYLSTGEQFKRSIKKLVLFWGIAIGTVFIPIFHFVLVPGFLILGMVMFFLSFNIGEILMIKKCLCPKCNEEFELQECKIEWPISQSCGNCRNSLSLSLEVEP